MVDYLLEHPQTLRLTVWAQLERSDVGAEKIEEYRPTVAAIAAAQKAGIVSNTCDAADLPAFTISNTTPWANASPALRGLAAEPNGSDQRFASHRTALVAAVRAIAG
ncbi:hypothetical protein ACLQ3K_10020 [Tsukamurella sp. DT100]|uniref:hypothetical protein n=1 Tax=Tsukamurella sp. DT100 TaxID=3393415 RepID=UPI003CF0928C